jgi:putative ABC transport system permease protein
VISLALAAVGLHGLVSFSVEQRLAELGIRRALGCGSGALVGIVVREGATLAGIGVALGVLIAGGLSRFIRGMPYGVEPTDPLTVGTLTVSMLAVAVAASLVPALRAMRVDPARLLRRE